MSMDLSVTSKCSGWNICASYGGKIAAEMSKPGLTQEYWKISCKFSYFFITRVLGHIPCSVGIWVSPTGVWVATSIGLSCCSHPRGAGLAGPPGSRGTGAPHLPGASLLLPQRWKHPTKKLVHTSLFGPLRVMLQIIKNIKNYNFQILSCYNKSAQLQML